MARGTPGPVRRRLISISTLIIASILVVLFGLPALVVALIIDGITRTRGFRRTRTVALVGSLVVIDLYGFTLVTLTLVSAPLGYRIERPRIQRWLGWIMTHWTSALMGAITRFCPIELRWEDLDEATFAGNAIMIGRHRSLLDAVLPAVIIGRRDLVARYTLKEDLRWEPNIDIVGHAMAHRFVTRSPKNVDAELEPIRELAGRIDEGSIGVIFPEGTFFTERRKQKIVVSLERRDPEHADIARQMQYLLAPRPGGTMALLEGAPDADVIIFGHAGFEPFGSIGEILATIGQPTVVTMRAWRIPRAELPTDRDGMIDWLFNRWLELDQWVASVHDQHPPSADASENPDRVLASGDH